MELDRYESSETRQRLSGQLTQRAAQSGLSTGGLILFGLPFVAAGGAIVLIGLKVLPVDPASVHAPYWVLTAAGAVFGLGGLILWSMAWRQHRANCRREEMLGRHRGEPALADYAWNPRGFEPARWGRIIKSLGLAGFLTLFLSMFNWWAFFAGGPWPVKAIVSLFDLFLILAWIQAALLLGRTLKFSSSRIEFPSFPYRITEPVVIRWLTPSGIHSPAKGGFTLRCVEESYEAHGVGRNRKRTLIHEQVWAGTWLLDRPRELLPGKSVELRFELPAHTRPTCLSAGQAVFWELEVKLEMPGLDFKEVYLVPVY